MALQERTTKKLTARKLFDTLQEDGFTLVRNGEGMRCWYTGFSMTREQVEHSIAARRSAMDENWPALLAIVDRRNGPATSDLQRRWPGVLEELKRRGAFEAHALLKGASPVRVVGDYWDVLLRFGYPSHAELFDRGDNRRQLVAVLRSLFGAASPPEAPAAGDDLAVLKSIWHLIVADVKDICEAQDEEAWSPATAVLLAGSHPVKITNGDTLTVFFEDDGTAALFLGGGHRERLVAALKGATGVLYRVQMTSPPVLEIPDAEERAEVCRLRVEAARQIPAGAVAYAVQCCPDELLDNYDAAVTPEEMAAACQAINKAYREAERERETQGGYDPFAEEALDRAH
jgi:hypothetical protein